MELTCIPDYVPSPSLPTSPLIIEAPLTSRRYGEQVQRRVCYHIPNNVYAVALLPPTHILVGISLKSLPLFPIGHVEGMRPGVFPELWRSAPDSSPPLVVPVSYS